MSRALSSGSMGQVDMEPGRSERCLFIKMREALVFFSYNPESGLGSAQVISTRFLYTVFVKSILEVKIILSSIVG